jgi:hypothetical protein
MTLEPLSDGALAELCILYAALSQHPEYDDERHYRYALISVMALDSAIRTHRQSESTPRV